MSKLQAFRPHPAFGYHWIPGLRSRIEGKGSGYLVYTNDAGFRCAHPITPAKPSGSFRVLLFGDSLTAGEGVSHGQRFGDLLEQRIPGLEMLNFGLDGAAMTSNT